MPAEPTPTTATLPDRARVVIVGGGVIGANVAYHLTKLGWKDVLLLERRALTSGTTWHAAGLITSAGMAHETLLWMARYTRDLYAGLEEETGQATGWRPIGHLHLARTLERLETLRREAAFVRGFGVDNREISPTEFQRMWPEARIDDVLAAFHVPDEGRINPADVTMALTKGARTGGATILEGVPVTGFTTERHRVTGVVTPQGTVECEYVVLAAGMWSRQLGELAGVNVPLQASEHYYMITEPVEWAHPDLPVVEDPDLYGYYREEGGGILVGLFEPVGGPWSVDRVPEEIEFASLPPDWDRVGPYLDRAMDRFPRLREAGIKTMFCGPESFTPDLGPMMGEAPELDGFFVAAGMNSLGILLGGGVGALTARWIVDGVPDQDVMGFAIDRTQPHETTQRFRHDRTVEQLGALFGDAVWPNWHPSTGRNVRRSAIHDRLAAGGASFSATSGTEYPEWFAGPGGDTHQTLGWHRDESFPHQAEEHRAIREAVGAIDMSLMANIIVQGRDAEAVLNTLSANDVSVPLGRIVYTQWLNERGGIEADVTVTRLAEDRFMVVSTDLTHRRVLARLRRYTPEGAHVAVTDISAGTCLMTVQGPRSRELLSRLSSADLSNEGFPYLTAREIDVHYARVLAMRVTYVGELGWELHVPADLALTVYDALVEAGQDLGYRDVGLLAMNSLRLEKGYRDYGLDVDNTDTPTETGLDLFVAWDKRGGFVGRDALLEEREAGPPKRRLVQFLLEDPEPLLFGGEPILREGEWVGYNRIGAYGHTLGGSVGLGMVEDPAGIPPEAIGDGKFELEVNGARFAARASLTPLYDPRRERIKA
ncbi:MAG TPA: FAD-dependent oxidoreductase [Actinomycetota bacterium]|nr:FAD-dependent oxidoreductase [Actinomycetota bacterium]